MNSYARIGRIAAAALIAAVLLAGCSEKPESLVASARELLARNDRAGAMIQLRNALQKNSDLAEARFLLGESLLETGDLQGAEKELRKAAELQYPADEVVPPLARTLLARGEYKKLIVEFAVADVTSALSKADLQTTIGQARSGLGGAEGAAKAFAAALATQPG